VSAVISPWQIYLILQLDSFGSGFEYIAILGLVAAVTFALIGALDKEGAANYPNHPAAESKRKSGAAQHRRASWFFGASLLAGAFTCLLPSTRTAAAMFLIPAVANNETIQREAGELYTLAKDALANAVKPDKKGGDK
jgi:hypothetical protein